MQHVYKATLISALNLFTVIGEIGAVAILAKVIGSGGYSIDYLLFGFAVFGIDLVLWALMWLEHRHRTLKHMNSLLLLSQK